MKRMNRDPFNPVKDAEKKKEEEKRLTKLKDAYEAVLKTPQGRDVILDILAKTQMFCRTFNTNALSMAYLEGRREVGLDVVAMIKPETFYQIEKEHYERTRNEP